MNNHSQNKGRRPHGRVPFSNVVSNNTGMTKPQAEENGQQVHQPKPPMGRKRIHVSHQVDDKFLSAQRKDQAAKDFRRLADPHFESLADEMVPLHYLASIMEGTICSNPDNASAYFDLLFSLTCALRPRETGPKQSASSSDAAGGGSHDQENEVFVEPEESQYVQVAPPVPYKIPKRNHVELPPTRKERIPAVSTLTPLRRIPTASPNTNWEDRRPQRKAFAMRAPLPPPEVVQVSSDEEQDEEYEVLEGGRNDYLFLSPPKRAPQREAQPPPPPPPPSESAASAFSATEWKGLMANLVRMNELFGKVAEPSDEGKPKTATTSSATGAKSSGIGGDQQPPAIETARTKEGDNTAPVSSCVTDKPGTANAKTGSSSSSSEGKPKKDEKDKDRGERREKGEKKSSSTASSSSTSTPVFDGSSFRIGKK